MTLRTCKHLSSTQPTLGGLAYWSVSAPMFNSNDRGTEIKSRVREGWDD